MHVAIIGNGISGITAARTIRKNDRECQITVISAESKYFFSRTALMYVYMGHMTFEHTKPYEDDFWKKNSINLIQDFVQEIDFANQLLRLKDGNDVSYDKLLIATGSKPNKFGWPGQDLKGVQGLYSYQDLELLEANTHKPFTPKSDQKVKNAVIVGGGLIGVELAEMLLSRNINVTFIIREKHFWGNVLPHEEASLIDLHLKSHGVSLFYETELKEIVGDDNGRTKSVVLSNGNELQCELVGLTTGVSPNIDFLKNSELTINRGIMVTRKLETNISNVYAAGDCIEFSDPPSGRKAIEQVWYTGRMMGEIAGKNMIGQNHEYDPGPWFNSAKFLDIEYQTYGTVLSELNEGEASFYWENTNENKCVKLVFNESNNKLIGVNVFGIRLRHEIMDRWIQEGRNADYFLENYNNVLFDPELSSDDISEIVFKYNNEFNSNVNINKKSWKEIFIK